MREIILEKKSFTKVIVTDDSGPGGASHEYYVVKVDASHPNSRSFAHVRFQNGPIKEVGVNGCQHEDLLAIVIDRLQAFQQGLFACRENALALTKLEEAMHWLHHRTKDRVKRGVEGTNKL